MYLYHHEMIPLSFQNLFQTESQISIVILLDRPIHTVLTVPAEQT